MSEERLEALGNFRLADNTSEIVLAVRKRNRSNKCFRAPRSGARFPLGTPWRVNVDPQAVPRERDRFSTTARFERPLGRSKLFRPEHCRITAFAVAHYRRALATLMPWELV
jgi:hypothetical protein